MQTNLSDLFASSILPESAPPFLKAALAHSSGCRGLEQLYSGVQASGEELVSATLHQLEISTEIAPVDRSRIPKDGPVVVVANHPTGILDGLVLAKLLSGIRSDLKILSNAVLGSLPELSSLLIPVDVWSRQGNPGGVREAIRHVASGGMLLVFPAGEVSRVQWRLGKIADAEWSSGLVRMIRLAAQRSKSLSVLPVHLTGKNTVLFHMAGALHQKVRFALLPRELVNKRRTSVSVRVGHPIAASKLEEFDNDRDCAEYLRWRAYLLAERPAAKARMSRPLRRHAPEQSIPVMPAVPLEALRQDVAGLAAERKLAEMDGLAVYLAEAHEIPNAMTEIARLREITFREAGEGTGRECDRDRFDDRYQHLFLWDAAKGAIVGAYRLARTELIRARYGLDGLYTETLFSYREEFLDHMGPAIELGRSFIRREYQRGFTPLLLLWKGIGRFVAMHPECKVLFGPVSISSEYHNVSRELMVAYLEQRAKLTEWIGLVSARTPFRRLSKFAQPKYGKLELEDVSSAVADIEPDGRGVPVLMRHYLKLGGRLLAFNIDPAFGDTLDGLIVVDLTKTERKLLDRYLGKAQAAQFLQHHGI